jgi:glycosyltransferase involved in cell wall biosynthesis
MDSLQPKNLRHARVGYVPISNTLNGPGDKRRFVYYANKRNLNFEIADPSKKYDVVVITQNADLSIWSQFDRGGAKIVYDLIDSYLAIPRNDIKGRLRGLAKYLSGQSRHLKLDHWKAIGEMCSRADAVVCSTQEQRADILKFCPNVHIILDDHTGVTRIIKTDFSGSRPFRLVWEGLAQNLGSLKLLGPVLDRLRVQYPIEVHIVTDPSYNRFLGKYGKTNTVHSARQVLPNVRFHEWKEAECANIICSCDLAVIPLDLEDPFAAGKPENKLLLLWRMAMPVVTSASPAYVRAMHAAGMNYTARDAADWLAMLANLIGDEGAREQAGLMGKAYIDSEFSEANLLAQWDTVFESLGLQISKPLGVL